VLIELDEVAAELFEMALQFSPIFWGRKEEEEEEEEKNCMKKS